MSNNNSNKNLIDSLTNSLTNSLANNNSFENVKIETDIGSDIKPGSGSGLGSGSGTESNYIWDTISNFSWFTWVLIFFVLAILGFNILNYFSDAVELLDDLSKKIVKLFRRFMAWIFSDNSNTNTVPIKNANTNTNTNTNANTNANSNTNINSNTSYTSNPGLNLEKEKQEIKNTFNEDTNQLKDTLNKTISTMKNETTVQSDDSYSSIQSSKISGKAGWCFIGEDRGIRSCMNIGPNDACMSGDIFPTNEICINPKLRA